VTSFYFQTRFGTSIKGGEGGRYGEEGSPVPDCSGTGVDFIG